MATLPLPERGSPVQASRNPRATSKPLPVPAYVVGACVLAVVGVVSIWPTVLMLWALWSTDPLKSIGGFVPAVSLVLILRVWRGLGWEQRGSGWGLLLLAGTAALVQLRSHMVLELVLSRSWSLTLPPHSLVAFAYASGVVLLFGGTRLWRSALFPLGLMLLVNPVPHIFNRLVDLPLQHASAEVARGLAHALGQRLTPDQLSLMFTPSFGMFIAPGCNGIRGSVTLGLLALVAGYLYRFRARAWALAVVGAVLLGYAFNLLRLCVLVVYYVLALRWPVLQPHAEMADYGIGATLFFVAGMLLFAVIRRLSPGQELRIPTPWVAPASPGPKRRSLPSWALAAGFAALVLITAIPLARGLRRGPRPSIVLAGLPASIGPYRLQRRWAETLSTGEVLFNWAQYAAPGQPMAVQVGASPTLGAHDTLLCHVARGEDALWQGALPLKTAEGSTSFSVSVYNDGVSEYMEASTLCTPAGCGQYLTGPPHLGLVYSPVRAGEVLGGGPPPVPLLLRVELPAGGLPPEAARESLLSALRAFAANAPFEAFTRPYLHR